MSEFDPHPNLRDLIAAYEQQLQTRDPRRPIRVYRAAVLPTRSWRKDATDLAAQYAALHTRPSREVGRCEAVASTGEHLGLEVVGLARRQECRP